jgi:hypothetical protein
MANKALATRQKMTMRVEPSQKPPRNPVALAAKQRQGGAGSHDKPHSTDRHAAKQLLARFQFKPGSDDQE